MRARSLHVSLQAIFLASWARVQAFYTSSDSSTFGLWQAGRTGVVDDIAMLAVPCMNVLPLHILRVNEGSVVDVARRIQQDLRNRSAVIEQTDLVRVDEWVGGRGQPLCNVFVNIIKVAPDVQDQDTLLTPTNVSHTVAFNCGL